MAEDSSEQSLNQSAIEMRGVVFLFCVLPVFAEPAARFERGDKDWVDPLRILFAENVHPALVVWRILVVTFLKNFSPLLDDSISEQKTTWGWWGGGVEGYNTK